MTGSLKESQVLVNLEIRDNQDTVESKLCRHSNSIVQLGSSGDQCGVWDRVVTKRVIKRSRCICICNILLQLCMLF